MMTCTNVDVKNNIFVNTRDESPYCCICSYMITLLQILTSDYNDLYYEPNQYNCLVRISNTKYNTLEDWQTTEKDPNSVTEMPNFITPYLHIKRYNFISRIRWDTYSRDRIRL